MSYEPVPDPGPDSGLLPFLIDWGSSTHPTTGGLPQVTLLR
jgi:hypothetical protein